MAGENYRPGVGCRLIIPAEHYFHDHINGISEHEKEHLTKENMQLPEGTERELPAYRKEKVERIKNAE